MAAATAVCPGAARVGSAVPSSDDERCLESSLDVRFAAAADTVPRRPRHGVGHSRPRTRRGGDEGTREGCSCGGTGGDAGPCRAGSRRCAGTFLTVSPEHRKRNPRGALLTDARGCVRGSWQSCTSWQAEWRVSRGGGESHTEADPLGSGSAPEPKCSENGLFAAKRGDLEGPTRVLVERRHRRAWTLVPFTEGRGLQVLDREGAGCSQHLVRAR